MSCPSYANYEVYITHSTHPHTPATQRSVIYAKNFVYTN